MFLPESYATLSVPPRGTAVVQIMVPGPSCKVAPRAWANSGPGREPYLTIWYRESQKMIAFVFAVMVKTRQLAEEDRPLGEVLLNRKPAFSRP